VRDLNGSGCGAQTEKSALGGVSTAACLRRGGVDLAERGFRWRWWWWRVVVVCPTAMHARTDEKVAAGDDGGGGGLVSCYVIVLGPWLR
jgi:hypothetical protein